MLSQSDSTEDQDLRSASGQSVRKRSSEEIHLAHFLPDLFRSVGKHRRHHLSDGLQRLPHHSPIERLSHALHRRRACPSYVDVERAEVVVTELVDQRHRLMEFIVVKSVVHLDAASQLDQYVLIYL